MRSLRRWRRRDRGDLGLSLVELMVTVVLMAIVASVATAGIIQTLKSTNQDNVRNSSLGIAVVGMNAMTKTVRAATEVASSADGSTPPLAAFQDAESNKLVFFSNVGTTTEKVVYSIDASRNLTEQTFAPKAGTCPVCTYNATPTTSRTIASKIPTGLPTPLFTYYDNAGAVVAPTNDQSVTVTIQRVVINLTVQSNASAKVAPAVLVNSVTPPNVFIVLSGSAS